MINLLYKINIFSENDYKEAIETSLIKGQKKIFFYLNSQVIYEASKNIKVKKNILLADYLIADGYSIVWAYKNLFKERINKVVFTYEYFKFIRMLLIDNNATVFFLGASKLNIRKAIEIENTNFPKLQIVDFHHGYFDKTNESDKIIEIINKSNAKVLIVGMGSPLAEGWIIENKEKLNPNLIFSVGGFFDFLSRDKVIAPKFLYNSGFEWVFRLIQEPRRLFKRYLVSNFWILFLLIKTRFYNVLKKH
jgi:N-acetylglucosaminyldiphosphoundecaprenol N-acetyl-beta-D-mannosaminyltransferase